MAGERVGGFDDFRRADVHRLVGNQMGTAGWMSLLTVERGDMELERSELWWVGEQCLGSWMDEAGYRWKGAREWLGGYAG